MPRVENAPRSGNRSGSIESVNSSRVQPISKELPRSLDVPDQGFDSSKPSNGSTSRQHLLVAFRNRSTWINVLRIQTMVVRNAAGSIAGAWLAAACYSLGDIFSGKRSEDQSRRELIVANSAWATITLSVVVLIARVPFMTSFRFIDNPDRRPTVWLCLKKLAQESYIYFLTAMTVMLVCSVGVGYLTTIRPLLFKYKFDGYVGTLSTHGFFTGITLAMRRIYYRDTCQGRERAEKTANAPNDGASSPSSRNRYDVMLSFRGAYRKKSFEFWRAYIKEFPKSLPAALAGAFVHILSLQRVVERGTTAVVCFGIGSMMCKLSIQESIKHYIIKKRIRSVRFMCAAVALPTVLIDTQTRIILLGTKNTKFMAMGTIGMASLEIFLRVVKAHLIMRTIRKRKAGIPQLTSDAERKSLKPSPRITTVCVEFEMWRRRLHAYHIAEISADTYAEYISMGCSAAILFFFGDHPHYSLLRQRETGQHVSQQSTQMKMLLFQVGVEVVVDFASTVLEMMAGIEFDIIKDLGAFLAVLFMVTAVLNINISVGTYMS